MRGGALLESALARTLARTRRGIVFAGHGVTRKRAADIDPRIEHLHMPLETLTEIVDLLEELEFDFLPMEQVVALVRQRRRHTKHWVCFTFDDGYQNNLDVLLPFFAARQIPFTVVVSTHHVATGERFPTWWLRYAQLVGRLHEDAQAFFEREMRLRSWADHERAFGRVLASLRDDERRAAARYTEDAPLSVDELRRLARHPLVHIGSHAHHHAILHAHQDEHVVHHELDESLRLLREWDVARTPVFCWPNGDWSPRWARVVESRGFPLGLLSSAGFVTPRTHPQMVPRFWLSSARRTRLLSFLALAGDVGVRATGRRPPPSELSTLQ